MTEEQKWMLKQVKKYKGEENKVKKKTFFSKKRSLSMELGKMSDRGASLAR